MIHISSFVLQNVYFYSLNGWILQNQSKTVQREKQPSLKGNFQTLFMHAITGTPNKGFWSNFLISQAEIMMSRKHK